MWRFATGIGLSRQLRCSDGDFSEIDFVLDSITQSQVCRASDRLVRGRADGLSLVVWMSSGERVSRAAASDGHGRQPSEKNGCGVARIYRHYRAGQHGGYSRAGHRVS